MAKIKLMAKLHGIDDLASFVPLHLVGLVLMLYLKIEENQLSTEKIEAWLVEAFTEEPFLVDWRK